MKLSNLVTLSATASVLIFAIGALEGASTVIASTIKQFKPAPNSTNTSILKAAIIGNESGGNVSAVNPHSGALGLGQVMPFNVTTWSKEALGYSITPTKFLNDSDLQNKILDFKIDQYFRNCQAKYPDRQSQVQCVASTWYSGQPDLFTSTVLQSYGAGVYPSIKTYTIMAYEKYVRLGGK